MMRVEALHLLRGATWLERDDYAKRIRPPRYRYECADCTSRGAFEPGGYCQPLRHISSALESEAGRQPI